MEKDEARKQKPESCDRCGRPGVAKIENEWLCEECYQRMGSCCPEFGGDDLWEVDEGEEKE